MEQTKASINQKRLVKISKYLSKHLRHQPQRIGLKLDKFGWTKVEELLLACQQNNFPLTQTELMEVVENNGKKRFAFYQDMTKIRANQGHSIKIDLDLKPQIPPPILYHGTVAKFLDNIKAEGLRKMSRNHVHLSIDIETAKKVGMRRGKPIIFTIYSQLMHQEGYQFFCSENGFWLVDSVPSKYLLLL